MLTWHLVINGEGRVLAVYGAALLDAAEHFAAQIFRETGSFLESRVVTVQRAKGSRPGVGDTWVPS
jgi:hypothetical protein